MSCKVIDSTYDYIHVSGDNACRVILKPGHIIAVDADEDRVYGIVYKHEGNSGSSTLASIVQNEELMTQEEIEYIHNFNPFTYSTCVVIGYKTGDHLFIGPSPRPPAPLAAVSGITDEEHQKIVKRIDQVYLRLYNLLKEDARELIGILIENISGRDIELKKHLCRALIRSYPRFEEASYIISRF